MGAVGQPGGAEDNGQGTQQKLLGAGPGNCGKGGQHIASHRHEAYERHALPRRHGHGKAKSRGPVRRQGGHEDQKEHGGEILKKQDPQGRLHGAAAAAR